MLTACGPMEGAVKIGITQLVEHPSLDESREGFVAALKDAGYEKGVNLELDIQNAQGDLSTNAMIAQKFAAEGKDLVFAISTPSAQAAATAIKDKPILFTAVTDPVGAKLVKSLEEPNKNVTGTSDTHPQAAQKMVESLKQFFPQARNVGIIYNSGEQNAVVSVEATKGELERAGLHAVLVTVSNSSEVKQAADSLVGRSDVLYVPKDNTVVSAIEAVVKVANENHLPLFVSESDSLKRGGFAGFMMDYYQLGYQTGEMAVEILKNGKRPNQLPVGLPQELTLGINEKAAKAQGIEITDVMRKNSKLLPNSQ
ncbi:sugar ABC transporter substrate-binding protein [Tumebacillus algifaecis]|uniref:Sugar ABC transporter substrate-binding protein n=1 Tax=Tumebacillus algifaecis TaxID=1214604 RepID=A0A223D6B7_9BACL|nr:sugar ABC transporter substrate-binding protein [Tumebacillus algifaecis]